MGGDFDRWANEPWEFTLWVYRHLQERDHIESWIERMRRLDAAELMASAFHDPTRLADERHEMLAKAAQTQEATESQIDQARELVALLDSGKVRRMASQPTLES